MDNHQPLVYRISSGLSKQWVFKKENKFHYIMDIIHKMEFSIQDINAEIKHLDSPHPKDIIYLIFLVDWIASAVRIVKTTIPIEILNGFMFKKEEQLVRASEYLSSVRSFVAAHPLKTDRHEEYGFDGKKLCIDIRPNQSIFLHWGESDRFYFLDMDGLHRTTEIKNGDYYLLINTEEDDYQFYYTVSCRFQDLFDTAQLYLDKLYAMDVYLSKQKRASFEVKTNEQIG